MMKPIYLTAENCFFKVIDSAATGKLSMWKEKISFPGKVLR